MADVGEELALQAIQFEQLAIRGLQLPADLAFRDTGLKFGALQAFVQIDGKQHGHTRPHQKEGILYRRIQGGRGRRDRKSTRLNSSHDQISYAVFCLKKKKQTYTTMLWHSRTLIPLRTVELSLALPIPLPLLSPSFRSLVSDVTLTLIDLTLFFVTPK